MIKFIWMFFIFSFSILHAHIHWEGQKQETFKAVIDINADELYLSQSLTLKLTAIYPKDYVFDSETALSNLLWTANPFLTSFKLLSTSTSHSEEEKSSISILTVDLQPMELGEVSYSFFSLKFSQKKEKNLPVSLMTPFFSLTLLSSVQELISPPIAPVIALEPEYPLGLTEFNQYELVDNPLIPIQNQKYLQTRFYQQQLFWIIPICLIAIASLMWMLYVVWKYYFQSYLLSTPSIKPKEISSLQHELQNMSADLLNWEKLSSFLREGIEMTFPIKATKLTFPEIQQQLHSLPQPSQQTKKIIEECLVFFEQASFSGRMLEIPAQKGHQLVIKVFEELKKNSAQ